MLSALIISYEQGPLLDLLLQSLAPQRDLLHKVVLVSTHPKARTITSLGLEQVFAGDNPGYGAAINRGLKKLQGDHVLILNDDVVLAPSALKELKKTMVAPGIYQPVLLQEDGSIENTGHWLWWDGFNYARSRGSQKITSKPPLIFSGAAFALHRKTIFEVGDFCEDLIFYGEEVDYALRALRLNHQVRLVTECKITHSLGSSLGRLNHEKIYLIERNRMKALHHLPMPLFFSHPVWTLLRIVFLGKQTQSSMVQSVALGFCSGLYHNMNHRLPKKYTFKTELKLLQHLLSNMPSIDDLRHLGADRQ